MSAMIVTLRQVLGNALNGVEILDYGSPDDFEKLWRFEGLSDRIIIVWGRTAGDGALWPIDASGCLSPLDWAAAYARHRLNGKGQHSEDDDWPQIMILDADPDVHGSVPTLAHYQTLREDQLLWLTVPKHPDLNDICEWLASKPEKLSQAGQDTLSRFLREIRLNLTEVRTEGDYDRHAISNIVAPMVLLGNAARKTRHSEALLKLLKACDLCTLATVSKSAETSRHNYEILLVDDQAEHGWAEWLKKSLNPARFEYCTSPDALLDALEKQLAEADNEANSAQQGAKAKDLRFRLQLPGIENATNPVLFLDLRLFSGKADAERAFLQRLLKLIEERFLGSDLAWPGFDLNEEAFRKARAALAPAKGETSRAPTPSFDLESPSYHEVLTWLPRVVALADMSLPIILFSSTGRRDLVEPFKPYGNIITSFEKPRLNDLAATSVGNAGNNARGSCVALLRDAAMKGRTWLNAREAANRIKNTKLDPLIEARKAFSTKSHFEIYHDESRNVEEDAFRVVSLLVGFDDATSANRENSNFPIKFCWGNRGSDEHCLEKRVEGRYPKEVLKNQIGRWNDVILPKINIEKTPILLTVAALGAGTSFQSESSSIFDPAGLDNINSDLLMLQWESLLVDVLPSLLRSRNAVNVSISLYGATRFRSVILNSKTPEDAIAEAKGILETFRKEWGIELRSLEEDRYVKDAGDSKVSAREDGILKVHHHPGKELPFKLLWRSLRSDSFWKVTADVLLGRRESKHYEMISNAVHKALGVTLAYGAVPMDPRGRRLHYLADVLAGLVTINVAGSTVTVKAPPFDQPKHKALVALRPRILSILNANRLLDLGNCDSEAFAVFDWLMHTEDKLDIAYLSLAERLMERLPGLQGTDLIRMVALLETPAEWMDRNRINAPERNLSNSQHQDVKKREVSPLANKASELDSPSADASSSGQLNELLRRWRIRRYQDAIDYRGSGAQWHKKEGFKIRRSKGGIISVFADLTVLTESSLDSHFKVPVGNSFKSDGTLLGDDWSP